MVLTLPQTNPTVRERVSRSARQTATAGFYQLSFQAMSTLCRVNFRTTQPALARAFQAEVLEWVAAFEARYSRFLPDSLICRINAAAGRHWVEVDPETEGILNLCQEMIFFTRGVFDPTALPLIQLWNWKAEAPVIPSDAAVQAARELVGWRKLQRRPGGLFLPRAGMALDFGGIGKEYAVDRVIGLALERGIPDVLVDFGQDVRVHGEPPERGAWHIGLQDPVNPARCWTGVAVTNHAVATSGNYMRNFVCEGRRYGHLLDPRTGYPVDNGTLAVSVIAPNCTFAGILSTAAFVLGPAEGLQMMRLCPGAEGCLTTETTRHMSPGFYAYTTS